MTCGQHAPSWRTADQPSSPAGTSLQLARHSTHWRVAQQLRLPAHLPQDRFVRNATQLYRSDFFPGLGWMLNTRVWHSVRDTWCAAGTNLMRPWLVPCSWGC